MSQLTHDQDDISIIKQMFPVDTLEQILVRTLDWFNTEIFTFEVAIQLIAISAALLPAVVLGPRLQGFLSARVVGVAPSGKLKQLAQAFATIALPIALYLSLMVIRIGFGSAGLATAWLEAAMALMNAWILVRLVTLVIQSPFWSRFVFYIAWPIAALDAFDLLGPIVDQMRSLAIPLGKDADGDAVRISILDVVRTLFYFALLFWISSLMSNIVEQRVNDVDELSPALKALISKLLRVLLPLIAFLIALQIVGFNLATLAVFSGAAGLGLGLGLQRTVANFVAGFTLIADRSIKPNDVIEIDGLVGWVVAMQQRYVALRTMDGMEMLIPNDRFMSEGLVNWSRSDRVVRQHAPFRVSYSTPDLKQLQAWVIDAVKDLDRVLTQPAPICNVTEFGDSAVNFDLCYWIDDPQNGLANVKSAVLMKIWETLEKHGVEIPFPQQNVYVKVQPPTNTVQKVNTMPKV